MVGNWTLKALKWATVYWNRPILCSTMLFWSSKMGEW